MNKIKAKLRYNPNSFEILEEGDHVICAVNKKKIRPYFLYFFFHFSLHPGDVLHDLFYLCVRR